MGNENSVVIPEDQQQILKNIVKYFKNDYHSKKPPYKKLDLSKENIRGICQNSDLRNYIIEPIRFVTKDEKDEKQFLKLYRMAILDDYHDSFFKYVQDGILQITKNLQNDDTKCNHREFLISQLNEPSNKKKYKVIDLQKLSDIVTELGDDAKTEMISITAGATEYPDKYDEYD